ncbi:MAG: hypothetical protein JW904_00960 [Spirochaetales bacterium]|nr:hypothetical protein [Spirochaetales bacterium]
MIGGEVFALDGCKLYSNRSREWSGTFKELVNSKIFDREKIAKYLKLEAAGKQAGEINLFLNKYVFFFRSWIVSTGKYVPQMY